jgi:N6-adenosine-specific RNA methylase IME4
MVPTRLDANPEAQILQRMDAARQALAEAKSLSEVKNIHSVVEAVREYLRQQKECSIVIVNDAAVLRLEAEARLGQMLSQDGTVRRKEGRPEKTSSAKTFSPPTHAEIGISRDQARKYRAVASVPKEVVRQMAEEATVRGEELTRSRLLKLVTKETRPEASPAPPLPDGKFSLIYADPPWKTDFERGDTRDVEKHYPTMTLEEIGALDIPAADHCVLFLWATSPLLPQCLDVIKRWGFTYKTSMVWVKGGAPGMGYYSRINHELLLIATKGTPGVPPPDDRPSSVVTADKGRHSEKPAVFHEIIERMYPSAKRLELFARSPRAGWAAWGNDVAVI